MIPTGLQGHHHNIEQYIINCVKANCVVAAYYGFLPAECHGVQGGAPIERPVPYRVNRPE